MSQVISVFWNGVPFALGWKYLPNVLALKEKHDGQSYFVAGFQRIMDTTKGINKHYGGSVTCFFLAIMFADAGKNIIKSFFMVYFI